jgi:hypothetical protein
MLTDYSALHKKRGWKMQAQKMFKLIIDANKNFYDISWNALDHFREKSEEMLKSAFDGSPLPQEAKDAATRTIDAYKIIVKHFLDTSRIGYENSFKTVAAFQEKAEKMPKEDVDRTLLRRYPHLILSL